jgi:Major Facilitator Superfamily
MDAKVSEGLPPQAGASAAPLMERAPLTHSEKRIIAISMMVPVFLGSVDQSIMATSLPTIGRALNDVHNLPWLVTAYLIAATALTPLYGKFADIHGRRAALLIALGIYMCGCIVSATSGTMLMLIFGRLVQGCGGGGLTAIAQMILGDIASPKDRAKYYAFHHCGWLRAAARRLDMRPPGLVDDFFMEFPAQHPRRGAGADNVAAFAAIRPAAPARLPGRAAHHRIKLFLHAGAQSWRRPLSLVLVSGYCVAGVLARDRRRFRGAVADGARAAYPGRGTCG